MKIHTLSFRSFWVLFTCLCLCIGLASVVHAGGTESSGVIAEGTKWKTPYYIIDSGVEGPTVLLTGGIHGDEPAGFRAAQQIRHWPIVKGRLIVLPMVNTPGLAASSRYMPGLAKPERNLNRNFVISPDGKLSTQGILATELWNFVSKQRPDWVIDLHEGFEFHISHRPAAGKKRSVGSSIIFLEQESLHPLIERALLAANTQVNDPNRKFVPLNRGPVSGSFTRAVAFELGAHSMIIETTTKDQPLSLRTRQHRVIVNSLLNDMGLINQDCSSIFNGGRSSSTIQVGFFDGPGADSKKIPRIADAAQDLTIHFIGPADIQPGVLKQFDLLLFPGGSGSKQAKALGEECREHVRKFVQDGGGYIGVCAGAYLCSAHYSWSLNLMDSSVFTGVREIQGKRKPMWYRGASTRVDVELTAAGKEIFKDVPAKFDVMYHNGPIISPKNSAEIEDYEVLAWFRSEIVRYEPQNGTMIHSPAIVSGSFGQGRVLSISPHPEADKALQSIIVDSIRWTANKNTTVGRP